MIPNKIVQKPHQVVVPIIQQSIINPVSNLAKKAYLVSPASVMTSMQQPVFILEQAPYKMKTPIQTPLLVAKIDNQIHIVDAISPIDNQTLLDSTLLIGDRIFDIKNGAIFSIVTGIPEYSSTLSQLTKYTVDITPENSILINLNDKKRPFDQINMLGWVPSFEKIAILGSGIETLNIVRTLRLFLESENHLENLNTFSLLKQQI
ncbi:pyridine nucleotide-disulfide oxidoreductase family protein, putative [Ichthyophthirius multifiliis]|uniref:Pyridine nucleotide-disulfide oxidoreductase family protein, putative n=1 Tax=Ichthyophthirius multifiliis TaxID=5932 RepID=G0QQ31_ICHMU|nr:pyridine nucleotide-disulfide oxidoreductase family protein, putative [Ichthyophthirius multifiliis]EGR32673.1 pyridine nucleotide-disulfide oxidoreductase family protein, putative [Ichthyophthirius multifiliis]|eukprot:XP_004036659.1 pyridine nucleotide-disulfide oxidoreductase family protein, putative [Ichthyophthirius multifiliis]